jgi:hypothetical protein
VEFTYVLMAMYIICFSGFAYDYWVWLSKYKIHRAGSQKIDHGQDGAPWAQAERWIFCLLIFLSLCPTAFPPPSVWSSSQSRRPHLCFRPSNWLSDQHILLKMIFLTGTFSTYQINAFTETNQKYCLMELVFISIYKLYKILSFIVHFHTCV